MAIFWIVGILVILMAVLIRIRKRSRGGWDELGNAMGMIRPPPWWLLLMILGVFIIVYSIVFGV